MAKRKLKKNPKEPSSVVGEKQARHREMTQTEKYIFSLAAIALVVAVCVAPLTAEISTCKYTALLTSKN